MPEDFYPEIISSWHDGEILIRKVMWITEEGGRASMGYKLSKEEQNSPGFDELKVRADNGLRHAVWNAQELLRIGTPEAMKLLGKMVILDE